MDPILWLVLAIPIVSAVVDKVFFGREFNWSEFIAKILVCCLVLLAFWNVGRYSAAWDQELLNGSVSGKDVVRKNCPSGWVRFTDSFCSNYSTRVVIDGETCTTYTDSNGNSHTSCTPNFVTEYHYDYDWEQRWYVYAEGLNKTYEIQRVDARGIDEPYRFTETKKGDPVSITHGYNNWIKAASSSIFHEDGQIASYVDLIPNYPIDIYDYYKVDRVLSVGVDVPNLKYLNYELGKVLTELGPQRQMNAILVIVDASKIGNDYPYAVRRAWQGFKKNDAVIFVGVKNQSVAWAEVLSWSKENQFNVDLRNLILNQRGSTIDFDQIIHNIYDVGMKSYQRRSMEEFEFLKNQIPVPIWLIIIEFVLSIGGSIGLSLLFYTVDFDPLGEILKRNKYV